MRFLIVIIVILLAIYFFAEEPEPKPIEKTFIGEQVKPLKEMEGFEQEYLKADKAHQEQLEEKLRESGG
jgi:hypothetical protein